MTIDFTPEPGNGTVVGWLDITGGLFAVLQRDDSAGDGEARWFAPAEFTRLPAEWARACARLKVFRGPVVLCEARATVGESERVDVSHIRSLLDTYGKAQGNAQTSVAHQLAQRMNGVLAELETLRQANPGGVA